MSGQIAKLQFVYQSKEYVIAREEGEEAPEFAFASEEQEAVRYPSVKSLLKSVSIAGCSLREIWYNIVPVCNDSFYDDDYILVVYGDSLGGVMSSAKGTSSSFDRYLTQHLLPSLSVGLVTIFLLLMCTLFVPALNWTFFGVAAAVIVGAIAVAQLFLFGNTKKYRQGNPRAHMYLLSDGVVIVTGNFEYAIPYTKIIRLDTEAGITIVTLKTVFTFIADDGKEITETLASIVDELKAIKKRRHKNKS